MKGSQDEHNHTNTHSSQKSLDRPGAGSRHRGCRRAASGACSGGDNEAAAVACRLAPRLHAGDAVTLVKGQPNRIRQAPGLAAARTAFRISAGEVWYVLAGPVCQDGMNWFQVGQGDAVGWTSEGTPAEGYYLGRATSPVTGETAGVCKANYATRLAVGMEVSVGDGVRQRIRPQPRKSAAEIAWLPPGQAVKIVGGPTCADGWIWWKIANSADAPRLDQRRRRERLLALCRRQGCGAQARRNI